MSLQPFRQGVVYDFLNDGEWHKQAEIVRHMGCTSLAINKCIDRLARCGVVENNGACFKDRMFRIIPGAPRPFDGRGLTKSEKVGKPRKACEVKSWAFERTALEEVWGCFPKYTQSCDMGGKLDSRVVEICPQDTQAAD
jgi:hypothetical protein